MVYSEVLELCQRRKKRVNDVSCHIGMTYPAFKSALEKNKLPSNCVVLLCKELGITPNTFFGWEKIDPVTYIDSNIQNGNNNTQVVQVMDALRDQLAVKDKQIERLLQIISER